MPEEIIRDDDFEYVLAITDPKQKVFMEDEHGVNIPVEYAIVFKIIDMEEATGEKFAYPISLEILMIPYHPINRSFYNEALRTFGMSPQAPKDPFITIEVLEDYIGGVMVEVRMVEDVADHLPFKVEFEGKTVSFKGWDNAKYFLKRYTKLYQDAIIISSGFILDETENRVGTTGWDIFGQVVFGTDPYEKAFRRY